MTMRKPGAFWIILLPRALLLPLLLLLLLPSCATPPLKTPLETGVGLYPFGTYQHQVQVEVFTPARTLNLHGVVSYQADAIKVIGLSPFGTTLFRIEENLKTGEIKKEFFMEAIRRHEERFVTLYKLIRQIITAPKGETDFTREQAHFQLSAPDAQGIYRKIQVTHSQFKLAIEVTSYAF